MTVPPWAELRTPSPWRTVDFISDLHLSEQTPATFEALAGYLAQTPADALFILGDLFEAWVGDDCLDEAPASFENRCVQTLREAASKLALFIMQGNRDFLMGQSLMRACGAQLLQDPTVLDCQGQRCLLSHGDALCLTDTDYLAFRQQVRSARWQSDFLAKPLAERQAVALALRQQSQQTQAQKQQAGAPFADVDGPAAVRWLKSARAQLLIHGHTHQPAQHTLGDGLSRQVLSDWDGDAQPPRAQVLRLSGGQWQRIDLR